MMPTICVALFLSATLLGAAPAIPGATFDQSAVSLPPGFAGDSLRTHFADLQIEKGEFETTAQYEARRATVSSPTVRAFVIKSETPVYDADRQVFSVTPSKDFVPIGYNSTSDRLGFSTEVETLAESTYDATNAFGAGRTVHKAIAKVYAVVSKKKSDGTPPTLRVHVPLERAPQAKESLRVLLVVNVSRSDIPAALKDISQPGAHGANGVGTLRPTINRLTDYTLYYFVVLADFLQYWVFDATSGSVLAKFDDRGRQAR
jgi:hypothetical protein